MTWRVGTLGSVAARSPWLADQALAELERSREPLAQTVRAAWLGFEVGQRTTLDLRNAGNSAAASRLARAQGQVGFSWFGRLRLAALAGSPTGPCCNASTAS